MVARAVFIGVSAWLAFGCGGEVRRNDDCGLICSKLGACSSDFQSGCADKCAGILRDLGPECESDWASLRACSASADVCPADGIPCVSELSKVESCLLGGSASLEGGPSPVEGGQEIPVMPQPDARVA